MNTTTFTATFTFPTDSILAFAKFIGYTDTIMQADKNFSTISNIPNPEKPLDFVARMAKAHNEKFVTIWANTLVKQTVDAQTAPIQTAVEAQILQPVKDAIQVTYQ